jgi:hypothetical protein
MSLLNDLCQWIEGPDGRRVPFDSLPEELQAVLGIEALSYEIVAALPFAKRAAIGRHLGEIAVLLQSADPLRYRRRGPPAWAATPAGHA